MRHLLTNTIGIFAVCTALVAVSGIGTLQAQSSGNRKAAKGGDDGYSQVIQNAVVEFDSGNWAEARVLFEQAHSLRPSARTLRGMGMTSFEMKEYVRSEKELNASLVDLRSPLAEAQRKEVLALLLRLERYIGKLIVRTQPADANPTITLDGSKVESEIKVDLGRHELSVQAPGYRPVNRTITIEGGKTQTLELTLTPLDMGTMSPGYGPLADPVPAVPIVPPADAVDERDQGSSVFKKWWFWTIVGVVAVGGATTAIVLTSKSEPEPPLRGNTGVAVQVLSWSR